MLKFILLIISWIVLAGCASSGGPKIIPEDKALISNALFYNGPGSYQDSTFRFSLRTYNNEFPSLFSSYVELVPGEYDFVFRCVRQPASGESYPRIKKFVEAGKCYIPSYIKEKEYLSRTCKNDAASKFTQYSGDCGIGGTIHSISGGCGVILREISCDAFQKLESGNTINELRKIERSRK